jgi:threonine aldolase
MGSRSVADFRSDTVTRPTPRMRKAMADAEVGDDVFSEDPTARRLEERVAELLGKEAALFVPTGTQGNQIAARLWTRHGEEIALGEGAHTLDWELAGLAALSGLQARVLPSTRGRIDVAAAQATLRAGDGLRPPCRLLLTEDTHNFAGGAVIPVPHLEALREVAHDRGAKVHLDGARLWNAAAADGGSLKEIAATADSVMVCFSKGLGAPIGSAIAGPRAWIQEARSVRKQLGGGMRQVGVVAAAALVALEDSLPRLVEDHALARQLANALTALPGVTLPLGPPETNILFVEVQGRPAREVAKALEQQGVLAIATGSSRLRFVTHYDVGPKEVDRARIALEAALG